MPTHLVISIGTHNTSLAVKEDGVRNSPKFIKRIKTEITVPFKLDPKATTPRTNIPGFIRLLGRTFNDPIIQKEMKLAPYNIVSGPKGSTTCVQAPSSGFIYSPTVLLEKFFLKVKKIAESHLGYSISNFVLTFPSKLSSDMITEAMNVMQKVSRGLRDFECLFINEFTAAVVAYGLVNKAGLYAVIDFGGRTLDLTLFRVILKRTDSRDSVINVAAMQFAFGGQVGREFNVIGKQIKTDMFFGGEDFDHVVAEFLVNEFKNSEGIDLTRNTAVTESLRQVAEKAKIELSTESHTEINVPIFTIDASGGTKGLKVTLTRSKFEALAAHLVERIRNYCETHLKDVGVIAKNVDEVILVGGMARVPMVKKVVTEVFGRNPLQGLNPDEAVALGAAAAVEAGCVGLHPTSVPREMKLQVNSS